VCSALSGWDHYLTGRYESAQVLLDRAVATLPPDVDPMRTMPLRINLALGRGDVATALGCARDVVAAGALDDLPSELTTAVGAAFAWAGMPDDARAALAVAGVRTEAEHRVTAHAMVLVAGAVADFHSGDDARARTAAERAVGFAATSGLRDYHGIAPALAILAATTAEADRAVTLARRATTTLGLAFTLTLAGDVMLRDGTARGRDLLDEARGIVDGCSDPGITSPLLARIVFRHPIDRPTRVTVAALVDQLSERELTVLRYLPSTLSLPEIARELYVSPNTVKTQCSAIYRKLGVNSRAAAVRAAHEHHLL
jgi:LuxR family maltose regulon positive regulatory protein